MLRGPLTAGAEQPGRLWSSMARRRGRRGCGPRPVPGRTSRRIPRVHHGEVLARVEDLTLARRCFGRALAPCWHPSRQPSQQPRRHCRNPPGATPEGGRRNARRRRRQHPRPPSSRHPAVVHRRHRRTQTPCGARGAGTAAPVRRRRSRARPHVRRGLKGEDLSRPPHPDRRRSGRSSGCVRSDQVVRGAPGDSMVPPAGFEPAHPAPEADALSPELRGRARAG